MNPRMLILGVAVLCGLGAMYGVSQMPKGQVVTEQEVDVVVVAEKTGLKNSDVIRKDSALVSLVKMKQSAVPQDSFRTVKDLEDRWINIPMIQGEPVVERKLGPKGSPPSVLAKIPDGMRLYTINVNSQSSNAGMAMPDMRVDILQFDPKLNTSMTIMEDVTILAVGGVIAANPDQKVMEAPTVSLAVTQDEANFLNSAIGRGGSLSLLLRSVREKRVEPGKRIRVTFDEVEQAAKQKLAEAEQKTLLAEEKAGQFQEKARELEGKVQQLELALTEANRKIPVPIAAKKKNDKAMTIIVGMQMQRYRTGDANSGRPGAEPTDAGVVAASAPAGPETAAPAPAPPAPPQPGIIPDPSGQPLPTTPVPIDVARPISG